MVVAMMGLVLSIGMMLAGFQMLSGRWDQKMSTAHLYTASGLISVGFTGLLMFLVWLFYLAAGASVG